MDNTQTCEFHKKTEDYLKNVSIDIKEIKATLQKLAVIPIKNGDGLTHNFDFHELMANMYNTNKNQDYEIRKNREELKKDVGGLQQAISDIKGESWTWKKVAQGARDITTILALLALLANYLIGG